MSVVLLNPGDIRENFTTKHKFCCTATSAEHVMTVPSYTSQSWEKRDESLATPLLKLKRERESDDRARVYHSSIDGSMHPAGLGTDRLVNK